MCALDLVFTLLHSRGGSTHRSSARLGYVHMGMNAMALLGEIEWCEQFRLIADDKTISYIVLAGNPSKALRHL